MELLDEESHRLLLWLVQLHDVDQRPTADELKRLAEPRRHAGAEAARRLAGEERPVTEGALASLARRGLVAEDGGALVPTELGRGVVDALGSLRDPAWFEVLDADPASADPSVFARVAGRVAAMDAPMVVDPWCRAAELEYLVAHTGVTKVLVSDRLGRRQLTALAGVVRSARGRDRSLRLRVGPAADLRDRCLVDRHRVVLVGGVPGEGPASGRPPATVVSEVHDLAPAARDHYRRAWRRAERLAVSRPSRRSLRVA